MKGLLDGKSQDYILALQLCVERFMESDQAKVRFFMKYADASTGMIKDRVGLLKVLAPGAERFRLIVQRDTLMTFLLINEKEEVSTNRVKELLQQHGIERVIVHELEVEKVFSNVNKLKYLLWVKQRSWYTSVTKVCFFNLGEDLLYLRELDESGYTFDDQFGAGEKEKKC